MKISIEMEPRELHEVLMLAAATMSPDDPEPTRQPVTVQAKRIHRKAPAKTGGGNAYTDNLPAPTKVIRAWAKDAGFHPPKGGMLPQDIIDAFRVSHKQEEQSA